MLNNALMFQQAKWPVFKQHGAGQRPQSLNVQGNNAESKEYS